MTNAEVPAREDVVERVNKHVADDSVVFSVTPTGKDENVHYYLVHYLEQYEGRDYLKERYFQIPTAGNSESVVSFKKQGMNRRYFDGLAKAQLRAYARIDSLMNDGRSRVEIQEMEPLWIEP